MNVSYKPALVYTVSVLYSLEFLLDLLSSPLQQRRHRTALTKECCSHQMALRFLALYKSFGGRDTEGGIQREGYRGRDTEGGIQREGYRGRERE